MKFTLVAAIRYLQQNALVQDDFIVIDLWGDEGYELQALARQCEGATSLKSADGLPDSDNPCKNTQLKHFMAEIGRADLAIQFIDSYPAQNRQDDELNLRVVIMRRETLQDALDDLTPAGTPATHERPLCNEVQRQSAISGVLLNRAF